MSSRNNSSEPAFVFKPILQAVKNNNGNQKATSQSPSTAIIITPTPNKSVGIDDSSSNKQDSNFT